MKNHYTYRITNLELNKHYYGTRSSKCLPKDDLGIKYFSSSTDKEFIKDQKKNHQSYKYKVIRIYPTRKEALIMEIKLHRKFNVGVNESFYNKCKASSTLFDTSGLSVSCTEEKRKRLQQIMPFIAKRIYKDKGKLYAVEKSKKSANTMIKNGIYKITAEKHKKYQNEIMSSGLTRAKETGLKVGKTRKEMFKNGLLDAGFGSNNNNAAVINIFNQKDELMFECNGDFQNICLKNRLPSSFLKRSYQNDGIRFTKTRGMTWEFYNRHKKFEGWYAKR